LDSVKPSLLDLSASCKAASLSNGRVLWDVLN
jgi:hypothetical protein